MFILASATDLVDVITSAAGAISVHASYVDMVDAATTTTPGSKNTLITTATTTTIVPSPAASTKRTTNFLCLRNTHATTSNTLTLRHTSATGPTTVELPKVTLLPSEMLLLNGAGVFFVYDASGGVKSATTNTVDPRINDFRLTGVSGTPIMTADSTTLSTIFLAQFKGNRISLFDGVNWQLIAPAAEPSLAVTGRTTDLPFDVFAFSNSGVVTLEFLNWTSATARATTLTRVDGVWTKTGDATRRYLGSCRPRSATTYHWVLNGVDAPVKIDLWNVDNRQAMDWTLRTATATWAYTLTTIRQAQASANAQVDIMVGIQDGTMQCRLRTNSTNSTISIGRSIGIGYDVTNAFTTGNLIASEPNTVASIMSTQMAEFTNQPAIGRHFYAWCECSVATGTCTWTGASATAGFNLQSGMAGEWTC